MRVIAVSLVALALAGPGAAATPRFAIYDLATDVARASHTDYGDIGVAANRASLARRAHGATLVRCGDGCRLGRGWIAFGKAPALRAVDVRSAATRGSKLGWAVSLRLSARGVAAWASFRRAALVREQKHGVPDVLAVVLDGTIYALPYATGVRATGTSLELGGFTPARARAFAKLLR